MNIWVVSEGIYYSDESMVIATFSTKEKATKFCRNDGFKWSTFDDSFINEEKLLYRSIDCFILDNPDRFSNWKFYKP